MNKFIETKFGGSVRVRCIAIIENEDRILLINHQGLNAENCFWMPPGGGVERSESLSDCVKREVFEETGLEVFESTFMCLHQHVAGSFHAIEIFFKSKVMNSDASLGFDPEIPDGKQFMKELKWISFEEIRQIEDEIIHPIIKKYITC